MIMRHPELRAGYGVPFEPSDTELGAAHNVARLTTEKIVHDAESAGGPQAFVERLGSAIGRDRERGVRYALMTGEGPYNISSSELILLHAPFGKSLESLLVIAEHMRRLGVECGLRDDYGRELALMMVSAPTGEAGVNLSRTALRQVAGGDMTPIARQNLAVVREIFPDIKRLVLIGYSFGATMTAAAGSVAPLHDFDVSSLTMGSPGNSLERPWLGLVRSFLEEGKHMGAYLDARPGPFAVKVASELGYWGNVFRKPRNNAALMTGLAAGSLGKDMVAASSNYGHRLPMGLGYGTEDLITPVAGIEATLGHIAHHAPEADVQAWALKGDRHAWGHDPMRLGTLVAKSFFADAARRF